MSLIFWLAISVSLLIFARNLFKDFLYDSDLSKPTKTPYTKLWSAINKPIAVLLMVSMIILLIYDMVLYPLSLSAVFTAITLAIFRRQIQFAWQKTEIDSWKMEEFQQELEVHHENY